MLGAEGHSGLDEGGYENSWEEGSCLEGARQTGLVALGSGSRGEKLVFLTLEARRQAIWDSSASVT